MGVPIENSLDITVVWALYGTFMCHNFWPMPRSGNTVSGPGGEDLRQSSGPNEPIQELSLKRDKSAHHGFQAGHVQPSSKVACQYCPNCKDPAKQCRCQVNTSFKPVELHLTECDRSFFTPLEKRS